MSLKQRTVVVVDDEEDVCFLIAEHLHKVHYTVYYALTLSDGLKKCKALSPEVIFLDNVLPDGSGIAAIPEFCAASPWSRLIVISAITSQEQNAIAAGAKAFIKKPLSFSNIDEHIIQSEKK